MRISGFLIVAEMLRVTIKPQKKKDGRQQSPPMGVGMGMKIFNIERKHASVPITDMLKYASHNFFLAHLASYTVCLNLGYFSSFPPGQRGQTWDVLGSKMKQNPTSTEKVKVEEEVFLL